MVQPTDTRSRDDLPILSRFDKPFFRSVLLQPEMRAVLVVVVDIGSDHAPKLTFIDCDHVVQAIPSQTANPSFGNSILPRRSKGCTNGFQSKPIDSIPEPRPVDLVVVANPKAPRQVEWAGFNYRLGGPLCGRVPSYVEVKDPSSLKAQNKEEMGLPKNLWAES